MNFEGFYGNERAKAYLNSAFARHTIPHALLITGERAIGKSTLADIVARALVCTGGSPPCNNCDACYKSKNKTHPDIIRLGTDESTVKVDEIRALKKDALLRPNDGERKVYIINHAEAMTHQAQDAFLKILEEPPLFTFFIILCYNLSDLLPTIVSRTAHIALSPLSDSDIGKLIDDKLPTLSQEDRNTLIKTSSGICTFLVDEKNNDFTELAVNIANALSSGDELNIFRAVSDLEKRDRESVFSILDELIVILRDACVIGSRANSSLMSRAAISLPTNLSNKFTIVSLHRMIEEVVNAKTYCIQNIGVSHITGNLICKLAYIAAHAALKG